MIVGWFFVSKTRNSRCSIFEKSALYEALIITTF